MNAPALMAALCFAFLAAATPSAAEAQVLRGFVRSQESGRALEQSRIIATARTGKTIGSTTADDNGRFLLKIESQGLPFFISVLRIGIEPTRSDLLTLSPGDTAEVNFLVTETGVRTDTIKVIAAPTFNEIRLKEAERRGWRIFPPKEVAMHRDRAQSLTDLLRSFGAPGIIPPQRPADCVRNTRNYNCLTIVLDGVVIGMGNPLINPSDVYFMAVLSQNQSQVHFGDRAPWGALVIYTRMNGDKY